MWWTELNLFQQIFFCIGATATLILVLQTVLVLIGAGHSHDGSTDAELPDDIGTGMTGEGHTGIGLVSVRGIFAFLASMGFAGFWLGGYYPELHYAWAGIISFAIGFGVMIGVYYLVKGLYKLQEVGNIDYHNAVGQTAKVYIPIPAGRNGSGKVTLTVQDKFVEVDAVTDEKVKLATNTVVKVIGILDESTVIVTAHEE